MMGFKMLAVAGVVLFVVLAVVGYGKARYEDGEHDGKAKVQALWDTDRELAQRAFDQAAEEAAALAEADRLAAMEVESALRKQVSASDATGRDLARRLHATLSQARACSRALPAPSDTAGESEGPSREPSRDAAVGYATEDAFAACARDAARLDGWETWWAGVEAERL